MPSNRTLDDLYRVEQHVVFDDGAIDEETGVPIPPVRVLVRKLSKPDQEAALRKANARRALVLAEGRDQTSELYLETLGAVWEATDTREDLLRVLLEDDKIDRTLSIQAELEFGEGSEWGKDGYLQGLSDLWRSELADVFAADPDHAEARRVFTELKRFSTTVQERVEEWWRDQLAMHEDITDDELRDRVVQKVLERRAEEVWAAEFDYATVWRATRLADNPRAYLYQGDEGLDRVRELSDEVFDRLLQTYKELAVGVMEGKGSPGTPASSPSSEPAPEGETSVSSGLATAST